MTVVALELFSLVGSASLVMLVWLVKVTPFAIPIGTCPTKVNVLVPGGRLAIVQVVVALGDPQFQLGPDV